MSPIKSSGPGLTLTLRSHRWGAALGERKSSPLPIAARGKNSVRTCRNGMGREVGEVQEGRDICVSNAGSC